MEIGSLGGPVDCRHRCRCGLDVGSRFELDISIRILFLSPTEEVQELLCPIELVHMLVQHPTTDTHEVSHDALHRPGSKPLPTYSCNVYV